LRIREGIGKCDFFGELEIVIENVQGLENMMEHRRMREDGVM
jgi:hypothetical protein